MDPLAQGWKMGVKEHLLLEDSQSSLKLLPPSKQKLEHLPGGRKEAAAMESALSWSNSNFNHLSITILFY